MKTLKSECLFLVAHTNLCSFFHHSFIIIKHLLLYVCENIELWNVGKGDKNQCFFLVGETFFWYADADGLDKEMFRSFMNILFSENFVL